MKTTVMIILISFIGSISMYSQKMVITLITGEKINAGKLYPIIPKADVISYKAIDGSKQEIKKEDLFCAVVNRKAIFVVDETGKPKQGRILKGYAEMDPSNVCSQAIVDAIKQSKVGAAGGGTGVVSFLAWPVGLVTATLVSSTPPSKENLHMDESKASDSQYCDCYKKEASKKKRSATWTGWGLGTSLGIPVGMLILML